MLEKQFSWNNELIYDGPIMSISLRKAHMYRAQMGSTKYKP